MSLDFNSILDKKLDTIERPPLIPAGTYKAVVKKPASIETIADGKYDVLDFQMQLLEPAGDDVDPADLTAYGGCGPHAITRRRFMFNKEDEAMFKRTEFDLRRFLEDHLKCATESMSLKEAINAAVNSTCLIVMKWRADKNDPEVMYSEISKTAPIE